MSSDNMDLKSYHRINIILWGAILFGIFLLVIIVFVLNQIEINQRTATEPFFEKFLFLFAVAIALSIVVFKRSIFLPANVVHAVRKRSEQGRMKILLDKIRRNYIIIWVLGEFICIIGIIDYILFFRLNSFLVYFIVSLYSLLINIPKLKNIEKCVELLNTDL